MSLGFKSCFQTVPWKSLATSHKVQPLAWPSQEPSDLNGLKPDGPQWASLFWAPLATSHKVQPPIWLSRELSDLSGLHPYSLPWLAAKTPLECLLGRFTYMIYCIFLHSDSIQFLFFVQLKHSVQILVWVNFQSWNNIVRLLFRF